MFSRIRNAVGLAFLASLVTSVAVLAKGGFSFISITGPGIEEEIRTTDLKFTEDFFAFADFYRDKVQAPADPGEGYLITRYYVDGKREIEFDQLHYYPSAGFVFYDGIVNGESEYDGEWYSADPAIKAVFQSALPASAGAHVQPVTQAEKQLAAGPFQRAQPAASDGPSQLAASPFRLERMVLVAVLAGLLAVLSGVLFFFSRNIRQWIARLRRRGRKGDDDAQQ